ncbi:hypothetical protein F5J12DRAFT_784922 [Pisolithus orientalis]|uniref:uncharacterized protein n=1 Tax=Pisolithus orientalis TaxID=936130 RepID=UPI00222539DD|nr:uncharacterized protein F5J12DRAFT_784922 [Pisolithus orientalis]KAI5998337.1 hypothetical protein F5J12DRAFT_784922 [Pisolithus orientalis]
MTLPLPATKTDAPDSDGGTFCEAWHYNSECQWWEGNLVRLAEVDDVIASIWHKVNSQGSKHTHSGAVKKEYLDMILAWSNSCCPLNSPLQYIHSVMTHSEPSVPLLVKWVTDAKTKLTTTQHIKQLACAAVAFMLWTRNYELVRLKCGDIKLDRTTVDNVFLKYLRGEEGSLTINDLGNHYKVYPHPDMGKACDVFIQVNRSPMIWFRSGLMREWQVLGFLERSPHIATIGEEHSTGSCMPQWGSNGPFDALGLILWEAEDSLAGEAALIWPASTEALHMAHAALTADITALHSTVKKMSHSQAAMSADVREICQKLGDMSNVVTALALTSTASGAYSYSAPMVPCQGTGDAVTDAHQCQHHQHSSMQYQSTVLPPPMVQSIPATQPHDSQPLLLRLPHLIQLPLDVSAMMQSLTSHIRPERTNSHSSSSAASLGLLIPDVPILWADRTCTPRSDSWKDIMCHWTKGELQLNLHTPLKDWPHHYYNGHTRLLNAIIAAHKQHHGDGEHCCQAEQQ